VYGLKFTKVYKYWPGVGGSRRLRIWESGCSWFTVGITGYVLGSMLRV
jgi:hypothetical protein